MDAAQQVIHAPDVDRFAIERRRPTGGVVDFTCHKQPRCVGLNRPPDLARRIRLKRHGGCRGAVDGRYRRVDRLGQDRHLVRLKLAASQEPPRGLRILNHFRLTDQVAARHGIGVFQNKNPALVILKDDVHPRDALRRQHVPGVHHVDRARTDATLPVAQDVVEVILITLELRAVVAAERLVMVRRVAVPAESGRPGTADRENAEMPGTAHLLLLLVEELVERVGLDLLLGVGRRRETGLREVAPPDGPEVDQDDEHNAARGHAPRQRFAAVEHDESARDDECEQGSQGVTRKRLGALLLLRTDLPLGFLAQALNRNVGVALLERLHVALLLIGFLEIKQRVAAQEQEADQCGGDAESVEESVRLLLLLPFLAVPPQEVVQADAAEHGDHEDRDAEPRLRRAEGVEVREELEHREVDHREVPPEREQNGGQRPHRQPLHNPRPHPIHGDSGQSERHRPDVVRSGRERFRSPVLCAGSAEGICDRKRDDLRGALTPPHGVLPSHVAACACARRRATHAELLVLPRRPVGLKHHQDGQKGAKRQPPGGLREGFPVVSPDGGDRLHDPPHQRQHQHVVGDLRVLPAQLGGQNDGKGESPERSGISEGVRDREEDKRCKR